VIAGTEVKEFHHKQKKRNERVHIRFYESADDLNCVKELIHGGMKKGVNFAGMKK